MAAFNKVILVGRLTRDVETRTIPSGAMVAKFGFAVSGRKKDDAAMFIDCEAWNRGDTYKLADIIRDFCRKGSQILIEGRLELDSWQDKASGQNRSKHKIVVDSMQLLDPKQQGERQSAPTSPPAAGGYDAPAETEPVEDGVDIPF